LPASTRRRAKSAPPLELPAPELVPLDAIERYPGNARTHDLDLIVESLAVNSQYRPLIVQDSTGRIIAGNGTHEAAERLGWERVYVQRIDVSDEHARRILLVDNRANDRAGYDEALLAELLQDLPSLEGTGYADDDLQAILASTGELTPGKDTEPSEPPAEPKAVRGDVYVLGRHRVMCGDSTSADDVDRLLAGERANLLFTDPPYGMSYRSAKLGGIEGDDLRGSELEDLVRDALALAAAHRQPGAGAYVWCTWRTYPEFITALVGAGLEPTACIVWSKERIGPGLAHYRPEHEFCLYCRPEGDGDHELCVYCKGETWEGGRGESDVWELPRDRNYVHPTQKPIGLGERALTNSTQLGGSVLDPFGGSGSTLIAAENLQRRAFLMELDPAFVDVIVDRWERHTGEKAVLEEQS
jgi:DNA modification methylase